MGLTHRLGTALLAGALSLPAWAVEITISCGAVGEEREFCEQAARSWAEETGNTVYIDVPPEATNERYFAYLLDLGDGVDSVDVYQIDVIWPGLLARHFVDLREYLPDEVIDAHYPTMIANNTVDGRLVGMPWYTDVGLLFYREDLLEQYGFEVPTEWSEMADMALAIQLAEREAGRNGLWGYVFQGAPYEGLTCNVLEWVASYGGGTVVNDDGEITINNPMAAVAINRAAGWVGTIAPERVVNYREEDARIHFQQGNAVFMRNWPYAWALLNSDDSPVQGRVGVAALPRGGLRGHSVATLGGWQLAVSRYSRHPAEAADLVRYLSSAGVQRARAIEGSYAPTIPALYEDPEVLAANPLFGELSGILENAVARPTASTGEHYMAVSTRLWEAVNYVMLGATSARESLSQLEDQLRLIMARDNRQAAAQ